MSESAENSSHPDPDPIARHTLEREIEARLGELGQNSRLYETRVIRPGGRRIQIHARKRLTRRKQHTGYTPDQLAHQLTRELEAPSRHLQPHIDPEIARDRLQSFANSVERILLLPELALSDSHLLTHIFSPGRSLLAVYLYPLRFDQEMPAPRDQVRPESPPRLVAPQQTQAGHSGLLGSVVRNIIDGPLPAANGPTQPGAESAPALHTFLVPHSALSPREINELQHIHDLYAQSPDSPDLLDLPDLL